MSEPPAEAPGDAPPRAARVLMAVVLVVLLVPGLVGFDAWPLTAWRLFSLARDDDQARWVIDAVDEVGDVRTISLEELPLRYRHAEWPMAELPSASPERGSAVCEALLDAVLDVEPDTVELRISRDSQRLVRRNGEWTVEHDPEVAQVCSPAGASEP